MRFWVIFFERTLEPKKCHNWAASKFTYFMLATAHLFNFGFYIFPGLDLVFLCSFCALSFPFFYHSKNLFAENFPKCHIKTFFLVTKLPILWNICSWQYNPKRPLILPIFYSLSFRCHKSVGFTVCWWEALWFPHLCLLCNAFVSIQCISNHIEAGSYARTCSSDSIRVWSHACISN